MCRATPCSRDPPHRLHEPQPLVELVPTREIAAHHSFLSPFIRHQVTEKWCGYGGSIESIPVVRDPLREEQRLQPLRRRLRLSAWLMAS